MAYPRLGAYQDIELLKSQKNPLQGILRIVPDVFFNFKKDIFCHKGQMHVVMLAEPQFGLVYPMFYVGKPRAVVLYHLKHDFVLFFLTVIG